MKNSILVTVCFFAAACTQPGGGSGHKGGGGATELGAMGQQHKPTECPNIPNATYVDAPGSDNKLAVSRNANGEMVVKDRDPIPLTINGKSQTNAGGDQAVAVCTDQKIKVLIVDPEGKKFNISIEATAQGFTMFGDERVINWTRE